jgi:hypothetical protein
MLLTSKEAVQANECSEGGLVHAVHNGSDDMQFHATRVKKKKLELCDDHLADFLDECNTER